MGGCALFSFSTSLGALAVWIGFAVSDRAGAELHFGSDSGWNWDMSLAHSRYNRVEGLNLAPQLTVRPPTPLALELFGGVGDGWSDHDITWTACIRAQVARGWGRPIVVGLLQSDVLPYGAGAPPGNSLSAFLYGVDLADYYTAETIAIGIDARPGVFRAAVHFRAQQQESLENATDFNLFGRDDPFRRNPPVEAGVDRRLQLELGWKNLAVDPVAIAAIISTAGNSLGGDFEYDEVGGDVVVRRHVSTGDRVIAQLTGRTIGGTPPYQALHFLGGARRLRGYEPNEFATGQFVLAAFDYFFARDLFEFLHVERRPALHAVPFFDTAVIFESRNAEGRPVEHRGGDWRFALGCGLETNRGQAWGLTAQARLDLARRFDRSDDAFTARVLALLSL